jgi:hypothetical protein
VDSVGTVLTPAEPPVFEAAAVAVLCAWLMVQSGMQKGKLVWRPRKKRGRR